MRSHVEWAIQGILGSGVRLAWKPQPRIGGTYRCVINWRDTKNRAPEIASALRTWHYLRFEVRDEDAHGGEMFRFTPDLGMHRSEIDQLGSVLVNENLIFEALASTFDEEALRSALARVLGTEWEVELEPLRGVDHQEVEHLRAI